ncbi:hypothetical protein FRB93_007502 [Tulasnella sp. JGI-2019a]|nr:hypothetical protein FRB93_007502 [Tulasnella sp. JGI-2019a]
MTSAVSSPSSKPMSLSPPSPNSPTAPATPAVPVASATNADGGRSPSQLATILAATLAELETIRAERDAAQSQVDSLIASSSSNTKQPGPSSNSRTGSPDDGATATIAALRSANDEQQRIIVDLNARLKAIGDAWYTYDRWMGAGEARSLDARRTVGVLINATTTEDAPQHLQGLSPRALPPQTQSFQLPSPLGNGPTGGAGGSSRRQSRPGFVHPGPPNSLTVQMQQIPPGAPGIAGKRLREPSPLPLRRLSNEDEALLANEPLSATSESEGHRMKRLRPDPRREKTRFSDSPRSATGQFMSPQYTFSSAQQQQQHAQQQGGADYAPSPSPQQPGYPRAGKPRTPQYDGNPPPAPPPRFSNSASEPPTPSSHPPPQHPPPLHINSGDHPGPPHGYRYPHHPRRESDTLPSAVTPTSAATTASARSNGSTGSVSGSIMISGGRGSKDSYPSPIPYSATRVEYLRNEEIFDGMGAGHRTDSPPPMMVLDSSGRKLSAVVYEGGRRQSQQNQREDDEDATKRRDDDRRRQVKRGGLLRVDVAPAQSKREGATLRRRSNGEDQEMREGEGDDNDDKDSVDEFLINTAINVDDDLNEQDELRDDDRDVDDQRHDHRNHHPQAHRGYHRSVSPTSRAEVNHNPSGPHSAREMSEREKMRWRQRDQDLEQAQQQQQQQQRRISRSQFPGPHQQPHPYHSSQLAPIQQPAHPDMNNQFYASNGLVKTKPERSGDVFRHYSTPGGQQQGRELGSESVYSPQQTYAYPRSPEGAPVPYGGRRVAGTGMPSPMQGSGEGVGSGGVEYVQQPSGGGRTSLPHLLPTPTPTSAMSNKSFVDYPPSSAHSHTATAGRHPQGHLRRHSSSSSPTTATSLPSVTSLMFPGSSPVSATQPTRHAGPGPAVKPTFNEKGERICRACGQPGRYRDGKCVEKWGPGPAGPGTVCDRCRKKMKRVERRGTIEAEMARRIPEQYYATSVPSPHPVPPMQHHPGEESLMARDQQQQPGPMSQQQQQQQRMIHFQPPMTPAMSSTTWNSNHAVKPEGEGAAMSARHGRSGSFSGPVGMPPKHRPVKEKERRRAPSFSPSPPPPPISNETRRRSIGGAGEQGTMMERAAADLMADAEDEDSPAGTTVKGKDGGDGDGDEDGDGEEEQEEEDAMGEEDDDDTATKNGGNVLTTSSKSPAGPPQPPPASTHPPPKDDHHPSLGGARSPRPGWVKLEDELGGRDDRGSVTAEITGALKAP